MSGIANHSLSFMFTISLLIWLAYANTNEKSATELPARILLGQGILFLFLSIMLILKPWRKFWEYFFIFLIFAAVVADAVLALVYFSHTVNENSSQILISDYECSNATFCSIGVIMTYINLIQALVIILFCLVFVLIWQENIKTEMLKKLYKEWEEYWSSNGEVQDSQFYQDVSEMLNMFLLIQLFVSIFGVAFASSEDQKSLPAELMIATMILIIITIFILNYMRSAGKPFHLQADSFTYVWVGAVLITWVLSLVYVSVTWTSSLDEALPGDYACNNLTYCSAAVVMKILNFLWIFVGFFSLIYLVVGSVRNGGTVAAAREEGAAAGGAVARIKVFL